MLYLDTDTLVAHSLEDLWALEFRPNELVAASPTILSGFNAKKRAVPFEKGCRSPNKQYNAGVMLLRPSPLVHAAARLHLRNSGKTSCGNGDQGLYNELLRSRTRCLPLSYNCREWRLLETELPLAEARHSPALLGAKCFGEHGNATLPHVLHFAMCTKPWVGCPRVLHGPDKALSSPLLPLRERAPFHKLWHNHHRAAVRATSLWR